MEPYFLFQISPSAHYGDSWHADIPQTECVETCAETDATCTDDSKAVADCAVIKNATGIFQVGANIHMSNNQKKLTLNIAI